MGPRSGNKPPPTLACGISSRERQGSGEKGVRPQRREGEVPQDAYGWQSSQDSCRKCCCLSRGGAEETKGDISWERGKEGEREQHLLSALSYTIFPDGIDYLTGEVLEVSGLKAMGIKMRGKRLALGSFRCPEERRDDGTRGLEAKVPLAESRRPPCPADCPAGHSYRHWHSP